MSAICRLPRRLNNPINLSDVFQFHAQRNLNGPHYMPLLRLISSSVLVSWYNFLREKEDCSDYVELFLNVAFYLWHWLPSLSISMLLTHDRISASFLNRNPDHPSIKPTYPFIHRSPPTQLSSYLSIHPSTAHPSIHPSIIYSFIHPSINPIHSPPIYLSINPSTTHQFIQPAIHPLNPPSTHPSIYPSVHSSVHSSIYRPSIHL